jgi:hypothetical protein
MIRPNPSARAAAISIAVLSVAVAATDMALAPMLVGTTGLDRGQGAEDADFALAAPVLVFAGILKLLGAGAQVVVVRAVAGAAPARMARTATLVAGLAGALLIAASGSLGLWAASQQHAGHGPVIAALGFGGLGATGLFAFVLLSFEAPRLRRWHAAVALLFGVLSLGALALPILAPLSVPAGMAFWLGLARRFGPR